MGHRPDRADRFAAVVLAGGQARRLGGTDKPGIKIGGRAMVATVADAAAAAGAERIIIVGPARPGLASALAGTPIVFTSEQPADSGPIPALRAGMEVLREPWLVLLAADMPFLRPEHVSALLEYGRRTGGAVLCDPERRPQWLASCWRAAELRNALAAYSGTSLRGVLEPMRPAPVSIPVSCDEPPPWLDCDTDDDLAAARDWVRKQGRNGP